MRIRFDFGKFRRLYYLLFLTSLLGGFVSTIVTAQATELTSSLCGIIGAIATVIGVFALIMFILGGTLYAFAHFLPAAGNLKGSMQGWGMGMLMGGIIALILYVLAPFIVGKIIEISSAATSGASASVPSLSAAGCA